MSIVTEGINKYYGTQQALREVGFAVGAGEVVGFLGPNGAGKSTMMKILTGFIPADSGMAWVAGANINTQTLQARRQIGYLPEHNPLYTDMFVYEFLLFVARLYRLDKSKSRVDQMVDKVGLRLECRKKIGQLSKGYRQRVGLAQAMIHNPAVLILDEPTTGLDPNQIDEIRNLIREMGKERTVLMSTHIMQEVEAICNRVIIINHGNLVADSPVKDIQNLVGGHMIIRVAFDKTVKESDLFTIKGVIHIQALDTLGFLITCTRDVRADLQHFATQNGLLLQTLQQETSRLEDVFRLLTKGRD